MAAEQRKYINEMANHMLNNNLALFIGAGFSSIFGYPSWGELLKEIIEDYELKERLVQTSLFSFVSVDEFDNAKDINESILDKLLGVDYLRLAGYIDYILRINFGTSIHQAISDKISRYEDSRKKNSKIQYLIDFFQSNKHLLEDVITTNYDSNIEYCLDNEVTVIHRNLESLNDISSKNKVFKIHGCISDVKEEDSSRIIITEKDYNNFTNKNKYLFYKVYSFFTEKKIVFIGYSINDPNIRSLLNDVIEENDGKVSLQIYWVTRDKLKDLDKQYYEEHFKLKIIEEIEIIDFFKDLEERLDKNLELREAVKEEIAEYSKAFIRNYNDESFIEDVLKSNKIEDVLQYLYNQLIEEESRRALSPYFILLTKCEKSVISKNKLSIQNILEMQNRMIFNLFKFADSNKEVEEFLKSNKLVNIAINSLIRFSKGSHPFGEYADSIKYLLLAYNLFKEEVKATIDDFIIALSSNISSSCSDSQRYLGYDWRGLGVVEKNIKFLEEEDLLKLVDKLSRGYLSEQRSLQLEYIIKYADISDNRRSELRYEEIYKKQFEDLIEEIIKSVMRTKLKKQYGFEKSEDGTYILDDIELDFEIEFFEDEVKYLVEDIVSEETVISVVQRFINSKIQISINGKTKKFDNYNKFEEVEDEFESMIERIIDDYVQ